MITAEVAAFRAFVDELEQSVERAEEPDWCVATLLAEDAADMLQAFKKAAELLEDWHEHETAHQDHLSGLADADSY